MILTGKKYCKKQRKTILKKNLLSIIYWTKKQLKKRQKVGRKIWQTKKNKQKKNIKKKTIIRNKGKDQLLEKG